MQNPYKITRNPKEGPPPNPNQIKKTNPGKKKPKQNKTEHLQKQNLNPANQ